MGTQQLVLGLVLALMVFSVAPELACGLMMCMLVCASMASMFAAKRGNPMKSASATSKRPVNLSINARTLDLAKELGMNLSQTVDSFLTAEVQRRYWERWNDDNKDAIDAYNARIEQEGLPLARYRGF